MPEWIGKRLRGGCILKRIHWCGGSAISAPRHYGPGGEMSRHAKIPANAQNGFRIRTGWVVQGKPRSILRTVNTLRENILITRLVNGVPCIAFHRITLSI